MEHSMVYAERAPPNGSAPQFRIDNGLAGLNGVENKAPGASRQVLSKEPPKAHTRASQAAIREIKNALFGGYDPVAISSVHHQLREIGNAYLLAHFVSSAEKARMNRVIGEVQREIGKRQRVLSRRTIAFANECAREAVAEERERIVGAVKAFATD
jgi:hypothetical protein